MRRSRWKTDKREAASTIFAHLLPAYLLLRDEVPERIGAIDALRPDQAELVADFVRTQHWPGQAAAWGMEMSPPGTFERVYAAIKEQLRTAMFHPGERLEPAALGGRLNSSVTPVRDALHRLTGERLVEAPRHEGFRVPLITETMLRHLYAWHLDLLLLAMARRHWGPATGEEMGEAAAPASGLERQNLLFLKLAEAGGNPEHCLALRGLIERMEPYQRLEEELLDAVQTETDDIAAAISAGDRRALRKSLIAYHRRRARIVPELVARTRSDSAPGAG